MKTNITNVKLCIQLLEILEEFIDLSLHEWNFRVILIDKLVVLLKHQNTYWRQRETIKWTKLGDANTKFFHANATIKHRKNLISHLTTKDNTVLTSHKDKELVLWQAFKERLGNSESVDCQTRLEDFVNWVDFLNDLESNFTQPEIDGIIKSLPSDKSPGPDGFSNEFLKKSWPIIRQDFYKLCNEFHQGIVCLRSINKSYITLIPKIDGAQNPSVGT